MNWSDVLIEMQTRLGAPEELRWLVEGITYACGVPAGQRLARAGAATDLDHAQGVSRIQDRIGPNRQGPFGLFQTVADALKLLSKEDIRPENADFMAYYLAPILAVFGVLMSLAVIPLPSFIGADLNIGVLTWWRWVRLALWPP